MNHLSKVKSQWTGGLNGTGDLTARGIESFFSVPKDLGGPGKGTDPEELLLSAAAGCFLITLGTVLEKRAIPFKKMEMLSHLRYRTDSGYAIEKIEHFLQVVVPKDTNSKQVREAILRAESFCMIGNALKGNVAIEVMPTIETGE